jgi:hypothetical protein
MHGHLGSSLGLFYDLKEKYEESLIKISTGLIMKRLFLKNDFNFPQRFKDERSF